jgi:hypothetical protein
MGQRHQPSDAVLSDGIVLKASGPWAPAVLELLRHLERAGFSGAPRPVGDGCAEDGRLAVTFVPGESPHPGPWSDGEFARIGGLLKAAHDAAASFVPPAGALWQPSWIRDIGTSEGTIIGHGDPAPWNIVGRAGRAEALIDWEFAGPVSRVTELAYAVWLNAQLHDDDVAELQGLPDARQRAAQAHLILDGYGVPTARRDEIVDRMIEVAIHSARAEAVMAGIGPDSTRAVTDDGYPVLWAITWRSRSASWMLRHRDLVRRGSRVAIAGLQK